MRQIIIEKNDAGQRLDKFMSKRFKTMPSSLLYKYIRRKCVRINGEKVSSANRVLYEGDVLSFYIMDEFFSSEPVDDENFLSGISPSFSVVYEDNNIILMEKPVGLLCQADNREKRNTLDNHLRAYLMRKGEYDPKMEHSFVPALCNRIDKNTHGIVIGAKNAESLRILNDKIKKREIEKKYKCLVFGVPKKREDTITAFLKKDSEENHVHIISAPDKNGEYKKIITSYKVLDDNGRISLLEVTLHTGRTHQIRAQMAYLGYPIIGDGKYGKMNLNKDYPFKYQALSACEMSFLFKTSAGCLDYLKGRTFFIKPFFENIIRF